MKKNILAGNWGKAAGAACAVAALGFALSASAGPGGGHGTGLGSIFGYKFNDLNGNGQDDGEPRIPGISILLNGLDDPSVSDSAVTNGLGEFTFAPVPRQNYSVCEVALPPLSPTTPECVEVGLFGKNPEARVVFGNRVLPSPSPNPSTSPSPTPSGCTRTQGFWGSSPAGQALLVALVNTIGGSLSLGTVAYTPAQLDDILDEPTGGNAILILGHQLIAAKLNILAGASSAPIAATIASADAVIGAMIIPPVPGGVFVSPAVPPGPTMVSLASTLDQYNNGNLGVPHCP